MKKEKNRKKEPNRECAICCCTDEDLLLDRDPTIDEACSFCAAVFPVTQENGRWRHILDKARDPLTVEGARDLAQTLYYALKKGS